MSTARELLDSFHNVKRHRCLSEYDGWITDVLDYLKQEARNERSYGEDPTVASQLDLPLEAEQHGEYTFVLLDEEEKPDVYEHSL